jgi:hypothetical protein
MEQLDENSSLHDDVSAASDFLVRVGLEGPGAVTLSEVEDFQRLAGAPSLQTSPRLAAQLSAAAGALRAYLSNGDASSLVEVMELTLDCYYSCRAVKTWLQGKFTDLPALEELFGESRPGRVEETLSGVELIEVGYESTTNAQGKRTDANYLLELSSGELLVDRAEAMATAWKPSMRKVSWQNRLVVQTVQVSPGFAPRRVKLSGLRFQPLERADLERASTYARTTITELHKDYRTFRSNFFAPERMPALLVPKGFYIDGETAYLVDKAGHMVLLGERPDSNYLRDTFFQALAGGASSLVFGHLVPAGSQLMLAVLGALGVGSAGQIVRYPGYND